MKTSKLILAGISVGLLLISCDKVAERAKEEAKNAVSQTNEKVQSVIDELGLVYVEEGAQNIITYDECHILKYVDHFLLLNGLNISNWQANLWVGFFSFFSPKKEK